MSDERTIPFGKYKGQEVQTIAARDPAYLQWLTQQAWFVEKFQPIYQIVVNNFAPPSEDTPAHNAMQARFLDFDYRSAFWRVSGITTNNEQMRKTWERITSMLRKAPTPCKERRSFRDHPEWNWNENAIKWHRECVRKLWKGWRYYRNTPAVFDAVISEPVFEDAADVQFSVTRRYGYPSHLEEDKDQHPYLAEQNFHLVVEIKPSMGDDYPAVLRQMKRQKEAKEAKGSDNWATYWILLVDEFGSVAVTFDQVQKIFAQDKIRIIRASDLREYMARKS